MSEVIIVVNVDVKSERVEDFHKATRKAQDGALNEKGCNVYTILQDIANLTKFVLIEKYDDMEAFEFHKTTDHFKEWREVVYQMMNTPRVSTRYVER